MAFEPPQINTDTPPTLPPIGGFRYPHLNQLWDQLRQAPELPQLDRWLRHALRHNSKLGRQDRLFYADVLFTLMRYLLPVVKLEQAWQGQHPLSFEATHLWQDAQQIPAPALWAG